MWDLRHRLLADRPDGRLRRIVRFQLGGVPVAKRFYWLVLDPDDVEICIRDPGFEVDVYVEAHIRDLVAVWLGHESLAAAVEAGRVRLDGPPRQVAALRRWFPVSILAPFARPAARSRIPLGPGSDGRRERTAAGSIDATSAVFPANGACRSPDLAGRRPKGMAVCGVFRPDPTQDSHLRNLPYGRRRPPGPLNATPDARSSPVGKGATPCNRSTVSFCSIPWPPRRAGKRPARVAGFGFGRQNWTTRTLEALERRSAGSREERCRSRIARDYQSGPPDATASAGSAFGRSTRPIPDNNGSPAALSTTVSSTEPPIRPIADLHLQIPRVRRPAGRQPRRSRRLPRFRRGRREEFSRTSLTTTRARG